MNLLQILFELLIKTELCVWNKASFGIAHSNGIEK